MKKMRIKKLSKEQNISEEEMKKVKGGDIMMGVWLNQKDDPQTQLPTDDGSWSHTVGVWSDIKPKSAE